MVNPAIVGAEELERAFAQSERGQSVRNLDLSWFSPQQVHALLTTRGFRGVAIPLPGTRGRNGERRYPLADRTSSPDPKAQGRALEHVYEHPDGGLVRLFPVGSSCFGLGLREPAVRKSLLAQKPRDPQDYGVAVEAFAVGTDGKPLPKTPREPHGGPTGAPKDVRRGALDGIHGARTKLAPGPAVPLTVVESGIGLFPGRTLVPTGPFEAVMSYLERAVRASWEGASVHRMVDGLQTRILFSGDPELVWPFQTSYDTLASLTVQPGSHTIGLDPLGHEASARQLQVFTEALLAAFPCRIFDDATGEEISAVVRAFPTSLVAPETVSSKQASLPAAARRS